MLGLLDKEREHRRHRRQTLDPVGERLRRAHQLEQAVPGDVADVGQGHSASSKAATSPTYITEGSSSAAPNVAPPGSSVA